MRQIIPTMPNVTYALLCGTEIEVEKGKLIFSFERGEGQTIIFIKEVQIIRYLRGNYLHNQYKSPITKLIN